jgi:hypothetical protein
MALLGFMWSKLILEIQMAVFYYWVVENTNWQQIGNKAQEKRELENYQNMEDENDSKIILHQDLIE